MAPTDGGDADGWSGSFRGFHILSVRLSNFKRLNLNLRPDLNSMKLWYPRGGRGEEANGVNPNRYEQEIPTKDKILKLVESVSLSDPEPSSSERAHL